MTATRHEPAFNRSRAGHHGVLDRACGSRPKPARPDSAGRPRVARGIERAPASRPATARGRIRVAARARGSGGRPSRLRSPRRRLREFRGEIRRPGRLRVALRARSPLPELELLLSDRRASQRDLLAQKPSDALAAQSVLRVGGERRRCHGTAQSGDRILDRPRRRRLPQRRGPGRSHGQDLRRGLPYRRALPGLDLFAPGILRRARRPLLLQGSRHLAATRSLLHLRGGAVGAVMAREGGPPSNPGDYSVARTRIPLRRCATGTPPRRAMTSRDAAYPVPPTVMRSMRSVGWPTPTGTPWPFLPQVPMPVSSVRSLPIMLRRVSASGPLPISIAPLSGAPTLPFSTR